VNAAQLTLHRTPLNERVLSYLLWLANSQPPRDDFERFAFYAMKTDLLQRFGTRTGADDWQKITHVCNCCHGSGVFTYWQSGDQDTCRKCWGSGVYRHVYYRLARWDVARRIFHVPYWHRYDAPGGEVVIVGKVRHTIKGRRCWWAMLALAVVFRRRLARSMISSAMHDSRIMQWLRDYKWWIDTMGLPRCEPDEIPF
jgi:hypothetical protein